MTHDPINFFMKSEKEEQMQTTGNRKMEIININMELSKTENR